MAIIEGVVERVAYHSPETLYTVVRLDCEDEEELVSVVGHFLPPKPGEGVRFYGEWVTHPVYGRQFKSEAMEPLPPQDKDGLLKYLASGLVKGVGPVTARKLVDHFGTKVLEVIDQEPEKLSQIPGIGPEKARRIHEALSSQKEMREAMIFLQSHGLSAAQALRVYKLYGSSTIQRVTEDPYALIDEVYGIGFRTADRMAASLGIPSSSPARIKAAMRYLLEAATAEGHVFLPREQLAGQVQKALEDVPYEKVEEVLAGTVEEGELVQERLADGSQVVYLWRYHEAEVEVAQRLHFLLQGQKPLPVNLEVLRRRLAADGLNLTDQQWQAVVTAAASEVMVLTGGPGTGKTTTLRGILRLFQEAGLRVFLAAPTGRAARRMSETSGLEAKTIHRLLEYTPLEGGGGVFQRDEALPLEADAVIIDEASMIDLLLMDSLLRAIPAGCRLVLVGDVDQLPSVGAGNVLRDIIEAGRVPVVRLTEIFRQARESLIVVNAHRINRGEMPLLNQAERDFFFIEEAEPERVRETIIDLATRRLPQSLGCDPFEEVQVLTPMRRTVTGVESLNQALQQAMNPPEEGKPELRVGGQVFRLGDKVMQIRNNYQKEVFNGDIGRVTQADPEEQVLVVRYPAPGGWREVIYEPQEWDEVTLAYAISVHKSQGSEYPVVILPLLTQHYLLLQRNLLYTAVTRAKRYVVIVGTRQALGMAVRNNKMERRYTRLAERISRISRELV